MKRKNNSGIHIPHHQGSSGSKSKRFSILGSVRKTVIVLLTVFLAASVYYWYIVEYRQKYVSNMIPVYSYSCKADIKYEVFNIPNEIIAEKSFGEGRPYLSKFVDYINTAFSYEFTGDKTAELNGTYSATGYLQLYVGGLDNDKILWSREYELVPETKFSEQNDALSFRYEIPIEYIEIKEYSNEVKTILNISSNMRFTVQYKVSIVAETDKGTIAEELAPAIIIPLSGEYFEIMKITAEEKRGTIDEETKTISPLYKQKRALSWLLIAVLILALLFVLIFTRSLVLSPRQIETDKIFKRHGSRIVLINVDIENNMREIIEISTFEGLVKIADDLGKPILYINKSSDEENREFHVIEGSTDYVFNLESELKNADNKSSADGARESATEADISRNMLINEASAAQ
jgi:hypothetical protein